ncbi:MULTISPECIES: hypothetical protein [unclassified Mesorhizobium]|uniref:hypothetical protein n=1 Tax=unclassified Mesorhizobium TaxID=325217 RepID=UPI0027BAFED8|nr:MULTISPECIES: hypothetical protein [unclassified Mesorhizobium]
MARVLIPPRTDRDDLGLSGAVQRCAQHPDNVWALDGLVEYLKRRRESEELPVLQAKLAFADQGGRADHFVMPLPHEHAGRPLLLSLRQRAAALKVEGGQAVAKRRFSPTRRRWCLP